jgi:hypothetical protein
MEEFRLIYYCRKTGKEYKGKTVTRKSYILFDPVTQEKIRIEQSKLFKDFKASPLNKKPKPRPRAKK